jgi:nicotinate-nucleotide adenylyltransferase
MKKLQSKINEVFLKAFGKTPLHERLNDIKGEAIELSRYQSVKDIKSEAGDVLCSAIQLLNENGWTIEEVVNETLSKIQSKSIYNTLGRKKNIAILGLAGNPPTQGHIGMGEFLLKEGVIDEVWFMPCYDHMSGKRLVEPQHRIEMLKIATQHNACLKVFDFEIKHQLGGETYHTVKKIEQDPLRESHRFFFVIGQDNANSFDKWYNFEYLQKMATFIVIKREGYEATGDWYLKEPHVFINKPFLNKPISSTLIRSLLTKARNPQEEQLLQEILNPKVLEYIQKHKLYEII